MLGDPLPAGMDEVRGPNSAVSAVKSALPWRAEGLLDCLCAVSSSPRLACLEPVPLELLDSRPDLWRSRCCFFFRPWSKLIMMSRIRGRKRSRLDCEASWLRVSSKMERRSSGTLPRSLVSTPMALKALVAILNSYPRRTYTSDTSLSVAFPRDQ